MKNFKTFFEDQETAIVPSKGDSLSTFLQQFEGSTIKDILNKSFQSTVCGLVYF
mgnify:CR=1 FL=1